MIRNRESLTDHGNRSARGDALDIATTALEAVHPEWTVPGAVERDGSTLTVGDRSIDLDAVDDVSVLGAGKGSAAVVEALGDVLGDRLDDGVVAEKRGQERDLPGVEVLGAGHPIPDETSHEAGRKIADVTTQAGPDDLLIACITGGASAQCVLPAEGISLRDLQGTTERLLNAGLPIEEVNAVRKHLSSIKGGRLAELATPSMLVTLVVVDEVAGTPWGPTVGDETTYADAVDVLERHELATEVPETVLTHLQRGRDGNVAETPRPADLATLDSETVVLADPADACEAARDRAGALGYEPMLLSTTIEGESREVAVVFRGIADEIRRYGRPVDPPCVVITGGETTVDVGEAAGTGGPNQEFGLAFAVEIADVSNVTALALGTDGTDGPTDVAGALVDGSTVPRLQEAGIDTWERLQRHDTTDPLWRVDDAVETGPTGTNVMDLRLVVVDE